jgi:hypothetical protein
MGPCASFRLAWPSSSVLIPFFVADPDLTSLGESQAREANDLWKREIEAHIPVPQKMYCSPLTRALHTHAITFDGIPIDKGIKAIVVEVVLLYYLSASPQVLTARRIAERRTVFIHAINEGAGAISAPRSPTSS